MATKVSVLVPTSGTKVPFIRPVRPARTPRVYFASEDGEVFYVPFAPSEVTFDNLSAVWATIERPGKEELLVYERDQLPQITFTIFIAKEDQVRDPLGSMEEWITTFRTLVKSRRRFRFSYGKQVENDWWRFTDVSLATQLRSEVDNAITVATADVQLTRASDLSIRTGPVTGGVQPTVTPGATTPVSGGGSGVVYRTVTIRSLSDTLWNIAIKYLGNGARWTEIAKLNNITDPRKLRVGQVLKIGPK